MAETTAQAPVNLWFEAGDARKRLPLVRIGDTPGRFELTLRAADACFETSDSFGDECSDEAEPCEHCGSKEVCGAVDACGKYDLTAARLQIAAEFCVAKTVEQAGSVTIHSIELVEPNCQAGETDSE